MFEKGNRLKVVVFGTGRFYQNRKEELLSYADVEIVAAIDNNKAIQNTCIDGVAVFCVEQVGTIEFDVILLMSAKAVEMRRQLLKLGIKKKKIWFWEQLKSIEAKGSFRFYCGNPVMIPEGKKILIISSHLGYHGGALAAVYAARALQKRGYNILMAVPDGNPVFINEMKSSGLNIVVCPALPYLYEEEYIFIEQFDVVIVNVFPMILCASEISERKPVVWWIHEAGTFYERSLNQFVEYANEEKLEKADIYAVSRIAQDNFNYYFPNRVKRILAYGIPEKQEDILWKNKEGQIVFAIIGGVTPRKAQDIFLKAVKELPAEIKADASFWLIGMVGQDSYSKEIKDIASGEKFVKFFGEMTREEIQKAYREIDVLVCPSLEDPLPIVVTEAMMYSKVCIVSDSVGTADYIIDEENGFVCETGNPDHLAEKMKWVIEHKDKLKSIGERARDIYEQYFTMDKFADRLEAAILSAMKNYRKTARVLRRENGNFSSSSNL